MKTSLSLLLCLLALPLLVPAQLGLDTPKSTDPVTVSPGSNSLNKPVQPPSMTLRNPDQRPESNSLSNYTAWSGPSNKALNENRNLSASPGGSNLPVSGLLIDVSRPTPASDAEATLGREMTVRLAPSNRNLERFPNFSWPGDYLKWGESDQPWSVVSVPPPSGPQFLIFRLHY